MIKAKLMIIICVFMTFINAYAMNSNERSGGNSYHSMPDYNSGIMEQVDKYKIDPYERALMAEAKSSEFVTLLDKTTIGPVPGNKQGVEAIKYFSDYTQNMFQSIFEKERDNVKLFCLCAILRRKKGNAVYEIANYKQALTNIKQALATKNNPLKADLRDMCNFVTNHSNSALVMSDLKILFEELCK